LCSHAPRTKTTIATKKALVTAFFTGTKLLTLNVIPREKRLNQNYFLGILIPELSRENMNARRRVGNNLPLVFMDSLMCLMHTKVTSISTEKQRGEFLSWLFSATITV
jgi:hypothetical protein